MSYKSRNKVYYRPDNVPFSSLSFIRTGSTVDTYTHYCYQISVATNKAFDAVIGNTSLNSTWGYIVNPNVPQQYHAPESTILIQYVDAESLLGQALKQLLNGHEHMDMTRLAGSMTFQEILPANYTALPARELRPHIDNFMKTVFLPRFSKIKLSQDERIIKALDYIQQNLDKKLILADVSAFLQLSTHTFRHLFAEQTGINFTQYLLWKRMQKVIEVTQLNNLLITKACTLYGFTDCSHFYKTFRRMFGITPKKLFKESKIIL